MKKRGEMLYETCKNYLPTEWQKSIEKLLKTLITVEEKILKNPAQTQTHLEFYFKLKAFDLNLLVNQKMKVDQTVAKQTINKSIEALEKLEDFSSQNKIKNCLMNVVTDLQLKNGQVFWPLRVVLTHEQYSPGVFEVIWALGKTETLQRLAQGLAEL